MQSAQVTSVRPRIITVRDPAPNFGSKTRPLALKGTKSREGVTGGRQESNLRERPL